MHKTEKLGIRTGRKGFRPVKKGKIWMKKSQKEGEERNILFFFPTVRIPSIFVGAILQLFGGNTIPTLLKEKLKKCNFGRVYFEFFRIEHNHQPQKVN